MTEVSLAAGMGIGGRQVRRILDLDHSTRLDHLLRALEVLGKQVSVTISDAAQSAGVAGAVRSGASSSLPLTKGGI